MDRLCNPTQDYLWNNETPWKLVTSKGSTGGVHLICTHPNKQPFALSLMTALPVLRVISVPVLPLCSTPDEIVHNWSILEKIPKWLSAPFSKEKVKIPWSCNETWAPECFNHLNGSSKTQSFKNLTLYNANHRWLHISRNSKHTILTVYGKKITLYVILVWTTLLFFPHHIKFSHLGDRDTALPTWGCLSPAQNRGVLPVPFHQLTQHQNTKPLNG